ncbi:MAG: hypothetical protein Q9164_004799 [Protoblastenia rupestris]
MSSTFGQQSGGTSLFGQTSNQQPQNTGGLFGPANTNQNKPNLFGALNTNTSTSQPQQGGSLFGSTAPQSAPTGGLFGSTQPAQTGSIFGGASQPQQTGGLFGSSQPPKPGGLFGSSTTQQGGLFGSTQPQQQSTQQGGGLFGNLGATTNQQPQQQQQGSSLFGNLVQNTQQTQQVQQQGSSVLGQSQGQSRLFQGSEIAPRQKSVIDQIELAFAKWNPDSPHTLFQTYLYNSVPSESAPLYGPGQQDDEKEWEEALAKKPSAGAIPVSVRGFEQLGIRMRQQFQNLTILRGRLHEINNGLNALLQKHDLDVSIRAAECRRRHMKLSRQCLSLAAKTQLLRNRGYAMDSAEEELRKKLLTLERTVFDPALNGRAEEIWARMVSLRERGRLLQREYEKAGRSLGEGKAGVIDEEVMKRAKKILEDYNSQLSHLAKEMEQIQRDWTEWEQSKPAGIMSGIGG